MVKMEVSTVTMNYDNTHHAASSSISRWTLRSGNSAITIHGGKLSRLENSCKACTKKSRSQLPISNAFLCVEISQSLFAVTVIIFSFVFSIATHALILENLETVIGFTDGEKSNDTLKQLGELYLY